MKKYFFGWLASLLFCINSVGAMTSDVKKIVPKDEVGDELAKSEISVFHLDNGHQEFVPASSGDEVPKVTAELAVLVINDVAHPAKLSPSHKSGSEESSRSPSLKPVDPHDLNARRKSRSTKSIGMKRKASKSHKRNGSTSKRALSRKPSTVAQEGKLVRAKSSFAVIKEEKTDLFLTPMKLYWIVDNFSKSKDYEKIPGSAFNNNHLRNDAVRYFKLIFAKHTDTLVELLAALKSNEASPLKLRDKAIYLFFYLLHSKLINPYGFDEIVEDMIEKIKRVNGNLKRIVVKYIKTGVAQQKGCVDHKKATVIDTEHPELEIVEEDRNAPETALFNKDLYELPNTFGQNMIRLQKRREGVFKHRAQTYSSSESEAVSNNAHHQPSIWALTEQELAENNKILARNQSNCRCNIL